MPKAWKKEPGKLDFIKIKKSSVDDTEKRMKREVTSLEKILV